MISPLGVEVNGNRGMRLTTDTFGVCKFASGIKPDLADWPDRTEVKEGGWRSGIGR